MVATVPTACGIETMEAIVFFHTGISIVATVPTACGIETQVILYLLVKMQMVATVPTVCGIETIMHNNLNMHL